MGSNPTSSATKLKATAELEATSTFSQGLALIPIHPIAPNCLPGGLENRCSGCSVRWKSRVVGNAHRARRKESPGQENNRREAVVGTDADIAAMDESLTISDKGISVAGIQSLSNRLCQSQKEPAI